MSVIQEHVVNNSVRYCSNMLQNTKICTVVHICGLLEMGSDSFLSTTPQKLNIFLRSFFFQQ